MKEYDLDFHYFSATEEQALTALLNDVIMQRALEAPFRAGNQSLFDSYDFSEELKYWMTTLTYETPADVAQAFLRHRKEIFWRLFNPDE